MNKLEELAQKIRGCIICTEHLPLGPRPIISVAEQARVLIVGQAPGIKVHESGIAWDDASGDRLRAWLGMDKSRFYSPEVAIVPMGFCYPGRGKSGDLPPRKECADAWHAELLAMLPNIEITVLVGLYAQTHYLAGCKSTLTETVKHFRDYLPDFLPLPHPSPRNNIWLKKNSWFEEQVLPTLHDIVG